MRVKAWGNVARLKALPRTLEPPSSAGLLEDRKLENIFLLMTLHFQQKTTLCLPRVQRVPCHSTDHRPNCLEGREIAHPSHSAADTVMSLKEGGGKKEGTAADFHFHAHPWGPVLEGTSLLVHWSAFFSVLSNNPGAWMFQTFAVSSLIFNDSLSLWRNRCCLSLARS